MEIKDFLISFIAEYSGEILAVIIGLPTVYLIGKHFLDKLLMKILVTGLTCAVLAVCLINFYEKSKVGVPEETQESTVSSIETTQAKILAKLAEEEYEEVTASSMYDRDSKHHYPRYLIDDNPSTNWTENVIGCGEGQYVDFVLKDEQIIEGFAIRAGNHSTSSYYLKNARPKKILISFFNGTSQEFDLDDVQEEQTRLFDKPVKTNNLRLTIQSVYEGTTYSDTVISDFTVLVYE